MAQPRSRNHSSLTQFVNKKAATAFTINDNSVFNASKIKAGEKGKLDREIHLSYFGMDIMPNQGLNNAVKDTNPRMVTLGPDQLKFNIEKRQHSVKLLRPFLKKR